MAKITILGTGYVGLVTGCCLADFGNTILCVDTEEAKIEKLKKGISPIYEPGLETLLERNIYYKRISFTTDADMAVRESDIIFIAVGTPQGEDGSADLKYVEAAARGIGRAMNGYKVIVDKSTVPVGTSRKVAQWIGEELSRQGKDFSFNVVSNPEFLREGSAIQDFTHPDRVVVGSDSEKALSLMRDVYRVLYINETPFIQTNPETAEMIKYASNAFLAMKITFINEVANLCEKVGANVQDVARAMGRDGRISPKFLHAGPGYGGSCFPKDTVALAEIGRKAGSPLPLVEQTIQSNHTQRLLMAGKIKTALGSLQGKTLAVLGLAFKPNTDDMRESPAITILTELAKDGASFRVYDPKAMEEARWRLTHLKDKICFCRDEYEPLEGACALVILTEWNQFRNLDLGRVKSLLSEPFFFDLRNIYAREHLEEQGFHYYGVGV